MSHSPQFDAIVDDARGRITEWSVDQTHAARERGEVHHFVDIREESEWAARRIPGATYIGRGVLERDAAQRLPDPDAVIVLYCGGGYRSALAADNLSRMGYRNVISMDGGIRGWGEAGLPIDEGPAPGSGPGA